MMKRSYLQSAGLAAGGWTRGLILLLAFAGQPVWAQSMALAPAQVEFTFKPGQPLQFDLGVSNRGGAPTVMRANVTDLWYNDRNEKVFDRPGSWPRSAANWIEVVPPQITVPAGGTGSLRVVITPPAQVSGGYYAVVFLESRPELVQDAQAGQKAVFATMRLGCLVLLSAENTEHYGIELADTHVTPPDASHPLKVDFQLWNNSNTHIFPETRVAIVNSHRELVAKAEAEIRRFLPQQKDGVSATWAGSLSPGSYTAIVTVAYGKDKIQTTDIPFTVGETQIVQSAESVKDK